LREREYPLCTSRFALAVLARQWQALLRTLVPPHRAPGRLPLPAAITLVARQDTEILSPRDGGSTSCVIAPFLAWTSSTKGERDRVLGAHFWGLDANRALLYYPRKITFSSSSSFSFFFARNTDCTILHVKQEYRLYYHPRKTGIPTVLSST